MKLSARNDETTNESVVLLLARLLTVSCAVLIDIPVVNPIYRHPRELTPSLRSEFWREQQNFAEILSLPLFRYRTVHTVDRVQYSTSTQVATDVTTRIFVPPRCVDVQCRLLEAAYSTR